jgi:ubiquitin-conjugating enzyme (huntingtin interacting protein 2)
MQGSDRFQGAICLDTLGSAWSPVLTIKSALLSLQSLLSTPEPKDPQDAEVASMLMKNPEQFQRVAREWAIKHAGAPKTTNWESIIAQQPTQSKPKSQKTLSREEELRQQMLRSGPFSPAVEFLLTCTKISRLQQRSNRPVREYGFRY